MKFFKVGDVDDYADNEGFLLGKHLGRDKYVLEFPLNWVHASLQEFFVRYSVESERKKSRGVSVLQIGSLVLQHESKFDEWSAEDEKEHQPNCYIDYVGQQLLHVYKRRQ